VTDAAVVGRILREYHQRTIRPADVRHIHGSVSGDRVAYRLRLSDSEFVVVRALRADAAVGPEFSACGPATMVDWLSSRAATLAWLAGRGYPAPRVVPTRSGDLVGLAGAWLTLATTFVAGSVLRPDRGQLRMLGEALGRLHALPVAVDGEPDGPAGADRAAGPVGPVGPVGPAGPAGPVGESHWHPDIAIPAALGRLDSVEALLPAEWRPLHESFRQTVEAVRQHVGDLPRAVVHGDAWPGNAILAGEDQAEVILIDWDTGGLGLPVLDLGNCLLECHLDPGLPPEQPQAWHIQPDDERIAAVAEGYSTRRPLGPAELDLLPDSVRFGTAFIGAIHFEQALLGGVGGASMDARLERLRNRLAVSEAVADRALHHLTGTGKRYAEPGRPEAAGA
jgi:Ser/Thr protein kinase RdoA (MazF antagonist)